MSYIPVVLKHKVLFLPVSQHPNPSNFKTNETTSFKPATISSDFATHH